MLTDIEIAQQANLLNIKDIAARLNIHEDEVYLTDRYFHDFQANYVIFREVLGTDSGLIMVFRKECSASTLQFAQYARDFYSEYSKV